MHGDSAWRKCMEIDSDSAASWWRLMKKHVHICAYLCIFVYIKNISANTLFYVGYNIVTHRIADATVGCCRGRGPAMLRLQVIILVACHWQCRSAPGLPGPESILAWVFVHHHHGIMMAWYQSQHWWLGSRVMILSCSRTDSDSNQSQNLKWKKFKAPLSTFPLKQHFRFKLPGFTEVSSHWVTTWTVV